MSVPRDVLTSCPMLLVIISTTSPAGDLGLIRHTGLDRVMVLSVPFGRRHVSDVASRPRVSEFAKILKGALS
jgi:hypothetical protein